MPRSAVCVARCASGARQHSHVGESRLFFEVLARGRKCARWIFVDQRQHGFFPVVNGVAASRFEREPVGCTRAQLRAACAG